MPKLANKYGIKVLDYTCVLGCVYRLSMGLF
jgi:hypothetical protein